MVSRILLLFFLCVFVTTYTLRTPLAQEVPCVSEEHSRIFEPHEHIRGYGVREGSLVKLSVSSEGYWLITLSPKEMDGAVCIIFMGTDWHFVKPKPPEQKVRYGRSN